jgi:ATP-binding cassette subfamily B protein
MENVHFAYASHRNSSVLRGLSISVTQGETLALVGASGAGKSTVISMIERYYDPIEGKLV